MAASPGADLLDGRLCITGEYVTRRVFQARPHGAARLRWVAMMGSRWSLQVRPVASPLRRRYARLVEQRAMANFAAAGLDGVTRIVERKRSVPAPPKRRLPGRERPEIRTLVATCTNEFDLVSAAARLADLALRRAAPAGCSTAGFLLNCIPGSLALPW